MRKMLVVALVVGLLGGSLVGPVEAAKKKKKQPPPAAVPVTFWFANDSGACTDDAAFVLKLTESTEGSNCGNLAYGATYGPASDAGVANPFTYNAVEGLPFILDASQKITGTIQVSSRGVAAGVPVFLGAGQATTVGTVIGTTGDESKELGAFESTYTVTPAQGVYEVTFEIEPPAELDKAEFTGLGISLHTEGPVVNHGYYRVHSPASSLTVPTWQ